MRVFVGLDLPWSLRERLCGLAHGLTGVRWVAPEQYHLTLRFIGEVARHEAEQIDLALAEVRGRAFSLGFAGVGTHQKAGRVTALWAGVARNPDLEHLQRKIEVALQRVGLAPERRRFSPHVTLARVGVRDVLAEARVAGWVQGHNLFASGCVRVGQFSVFASYPGLEHAEVEVVQDYPLAGAGLGMVDERDCAGWA